jgi:hypothetical protein
MSEFPDTKEYETLHFKPGGVLKGKGSEILAGVFFFIHAFIRKQRPRQH